MSHSEAETLVKPTLVDLDKNRCSIEDDLGVVFSEETWQCIRLIIQVYLGGRLARDSAPLSAKDRAAVMNIAEAAIQLAKAIHATPIGIFMRLLASFPGHKSTFSNALNSNALNSKTQNRAAVIEHLMAEQPSSREVLNWALACVALLETTPSQKKGQKQSIRETNMFLAMMKNCLDSSVPQVRGSDGPSFNKFACRIFKLLPKQYPNRPHSVEAALKAFRRSGLGQE